MKKNSERLIDAAYSDPDKPQILAIREIHTDINTTLFVAENAAALAEKAVTAHFVEAPYQLNPVLEAHRKGIIDDGQLKDVFQAYAETTYCPDNIMAQYDAILHLNKFGISTVAIDPRDDDSEINPIFKNAGVDIKSLEQNFPANELFKQIVENSDAPKDSVSAALAVEYLSKHGGNGVLTYGAGHMMGFYDDGLEVQGILDDALEAQGVTVMDGLVVYDRISLEKSTSVAEMAKSEQEKITRFLLPRRQFSADERDFVYFMKDDIYMDKEELRKKGVTNPFPPQEYPSVRDMYSEKDLNPLRRTPPEPPLSEPSFP